MFIVHQFFSKKIFLKKLLSDPVRVPQSGLGTTAVDTGSRLVMARVSLVHSPIAGLDRITSSNSILGVYMDKFRYRIYHT